MGIFSWLFPSPQDRLARARETLERGHAADARLMAMEVDLPEAAAVVEAAERRLALDNLQEVRTWADAGDDGRVEAHLELADRFKKPDLEEAFRDTRRYARERREARTAEERRRREEREARQRASDPLGITGGANLLDGVGPGDVLGPDAEERAQRLALLVESYPKALRDTVAPLGRPFADAVLALDDGRPDLALQGLLSLPDDHPVVVWERARASLALGDAPAAAELVRRFVALVGHQPMVPVHSAILLAQLLAHTGRLDDALRELAVARQKEPNVGDLVFAELLEAKGQLADAEKVLLAAVRVQPKALPLYGALGRVRLAGGHRFEAMQAFERAMDQCTCGTGKCGSQAPDPGITRALATLYLEDGADVARGLELADVALGFVRQPRWEDAWLATLAGWRRGEPGAHEQFGRLRAALPDGDPRVARVDATLAAASA
jgi:tetratricopeptide (TPR) repeat protein